MNLLNRFRKKTPSAKKIKESIIAFNKLWEADIHDIWDITDINQFLIAMNGWICRKCDYGSHLDVLSDQEQTIYFTLQLESEVNNGGFSQFFYNAYGDIPAKLITSFIAINAEKTALICKKAIGAFGDAMPSDKSEREEFLDRALTDEVDRILSECDNEFYNQTYKSENLELLNYRFILKHKLYFT